MGYRSDVAFEYRHTDLQLITNTFILTHPDHWKILTEYCEINTGGDAHQEGITCSWLLSEGVRVTNDTQYLLGVISDRKWYSGDDLVNAVEALIAFYEAYQEGVIARVTVEGVFIRHGEDSGDTEESTIGNFMHDFGPYTERIMEWR